MYPLHIVIAIAIGIGATLLMDLWALLLRRLFGVRSLDYCLLGRWVLSISHGQLMHENIATTPRRKGECLVGWVTHYSTGVALALLFVLVVSSGWLARPTFLPALAFGIVTVVLPFFVLQPALGLGIASAKAANPHIMRLRSLATHGVFGGGLYVCAVLISRVRT